MIVVRNREVQDRWLLELQLWAVSQGITSWLIDLCPYEECRVAGIVDRLVIDPTISVIRAFVNDGTGTVVADWAIRRPTPELALCPGRAVVLEGIAGVEINGLVLHEPSFETVSFPEVA